MNYLVVDVGNTDLVLGYWSKLSQDPKILRINTKNIINNNNIFESFIRTSSTELAIPDHLPIVVSSVVPAVSEIIITTLKKVFHSEVKVLSKSTFSKLPLTILQPDEIGTDLVANALAAFTLYRKNSVIVDFGTAISFTTVDEAGKILGVSIAPGIRTAMASLTAHAAQLQDVPLEMPGSVLGQNTIHAIQAGILYGYDGLVRGIIHTQEKELKHKLLVIATGGLSRIIPTLTDRIDHYIPNLTVEGLKLAGEWMD